MNIIALESQKALDSSSFKDSKDNINIELNEFLSKLSSDEIMQFKISKDFSELVNAIKTSDINNVELKNLEDLKNLDDHIIESMIKRYIENA
jgi:hypothetical protein